MPVESASDVNFTRTPPVLPEAACQKVRAKQTIWLFEEYEYHAATGMYLERPKPIHSVSWWHDRARDGATRSRGKLRSSAARQSG